MAFYLVPIGRLFTQPAAAEETGRLCVAPFYLFAAIGPVFTGESFDYDPIYYFVSNKSVRAVSVICTTAGCSSLRSGDIA